MFKGSKIGFFVVMLLFMGCAKEESRFPNVYVQLNINLFDPAYVELNTFGGSAFIYNMGIAGIVVFNNGSFYSAYDLCSPINPEERFPLILDDIGFNLEDTRNGAKFDLRTGLPSKGSAKGRLNQYHVLQQGNVLRINNY